MAGRPSADGRLGPCAWVGPRGEYCDRHGPVVKGLCPNHYAGLTAKLRAQGLDRRGRVIAPRFCTCEEPVPEQVRLFGWATVDGAVMCRRCGRGVVPRPASGSVA